VADQAQGGTRGGHVMLSYNWDVQPTIKRINRQRHPFIPLEYWLFTPELQWHSRGKMAYLTGASTARCSSAVTGGRSQYPYHNLCMFCFVWGVGDECRGCVWRAALVQ
jgi:hypothetical protein